MSELCQKILERILAGDKPTDVGKRFLATYQTVYNVKKVYEETGSTKTPGQDAKICQVSRKCGEGEEHNQGAAINIHPETGK